MVVASFQTAKGRTLIAGDSGKQQPRRIERTNAPGRVDRSANRIREHTLICGVENTHTLCKVRGVSVFAKSSGEYAERDTPSLELGSDF